MFVIESDSEDHCLRIEEKLFPDGYSQIGRLVANVFYSLDKRFAGKINNKFFKGVDLAHTQHPHDAGGDEVIVVDIDTRSIQAVQK